MKPEAVIFTVEVFNALYVSNALQLTSSWALTGMVTAIDLMLFCLSTLDVITVLKDVTFLMNKIPPGHPMAKESFLQIAMRIIAVEGRRRGIRSDGLVVDGQINRFSGLSERVQDTMKEHTGRKAVIVSSSRTQRYMKQAISGAQVYPVLTTVKSKSDQQSIPTDKLQAQSDSKFSMDITAMFSLSERAIFIDKIARVFFITEYLVLMEYTEVLLPVIYCMD
ncbi:unnamed protein product [Phytophthora fragariaefolia]|uniref:Unnamed protein product n=1 Tax=Phytophthora fragariaefolia TaxID=1490495 RepID=A0A9W6XVN4_9STRA|nr:unnamed protein product [Phytophthora fragariaefolia]